MLLQGVGLSVTEKCNSVTDFSNANQSSIKALKAKIMAGPLGFEPRVSGSAGRCNNPYYTTSPLFSPYKTLGQRSKYFAHT
jgi:hypothetical protein